MAEKTLQEALGSGATQTATTITLLKSDLGLTALIATADQVVAAVAIKAKAALTQTQFDGEAQQKVFLNDGYNSFVLKGTEQLIVRQIVINLAQTDSVTTLDPNTY